jgi:penicillin-binding protein-related factor A (putative recombinase)
MQNGKKFERELEYTFESMCRSEGVAFLAGMAVPTAPTMHAGRHLRVLSGTAPFDYYGQMRTGIFIGMEAKHNDKVKQSLPIIGPKKKGSGLQYHQLESLSVVASNGGIARIVWDNGGLVMSLGNQAILAVQESYNEGGRKSIPRDLFTVCEQRLSNGIPYTSWLNAQEDS